jgi:hypothetical protein
MSALHKANIHGPSWARQGNVLTDLVCTPTAVVSVRVVRLDLADLAAQKLGVRLKPDGEQRPVTRRECAK